jgi:hypothetical protein
VFPEQLERDLEVPGQRGFHLQGFPGDRMDQLDLPGVQREARRQRPFLFVILRPITPLQLAQQERGAVAVQRIREDRKS